MKYIFVLHKDNLDLAREEVLRLVGNLKKEIFFMQYDNLLVINVKKFTLSELKILTRLAYTKKIIELFFESNKPSLIKSIDGFDWNKIYRKDFSVKSFGFGKQFNVRNISSMIYRKLKKPKVNLHNPVTAIEFYRYKTNIFVGRRLVEIKHNFAARKAHNRPKNFPASLDPKLARAMVNLVGKQKAKILDPFCGSGGILIEAGMLGHESVGYDISDKMLDMAKVNLAHYKIKSKLMKKDATKISRGKYDAVITELPFGRSSIITTDIKKLYLNFLEKIQKVTNLVIVSFPNDIKIRDLLRKIRENRLSLGCKAEFEIYLHKSLSKIIFILEK